IEPLFAIDVTPVINYGALLPGEISLSDVAANITNLGNVETDLAIRGYAFNDGDPWAMNCSGYGNINLEYERYSLTADLGFEAMTYNLTNHFINLTDFDLEKKIDESENSTKSIYWKLQVTQATLGYCTGTVIFSAYQPE
ncbi:hypothetical protein KY320_00900, partial [Candidatus Woesearchaeota archaeon]|nr:hypothetical protein [Candidatus Woesearchaeota archaeon]